MSAALETPGGEEAIDRALIAATQAGLALVAEPYAHLAEQLGLPVVVVEQRLRSMLERGVIRRIAAVPNHYRLGYRANAMSVWDIPDRLASEVGREVAALDFVSHCYRRPRRPAWPFNLFAMVHGRTPAEAQAKVAAIARLLHGRARSHDVLLSSRILKKTGVRLPGGR